MSYSLSGEITKDCPESLGAGVTLETVVIDNANGGSFSESGTLAPGSYSFSIEVGGNQPFGDDDGDLAGVDCSYSYSFSLTVSG
jgi:hypothetical protein